MFLCVGLIFQQQLFFYQSQCVSITTVFAEADLDLLKNLELKVCFNLQFLNFTLLVNDYWRIDGLFLLFEQDEISFTGLKISVV